jgi:thiopeptide-type bacteriocin biosynthesis protein
MTLVAECVKAENLAASGFFGLRTPLLPFDDLIKWSDSLQARHACGANPNIKCLVWRADVDVLRARLRSVIDLPEVRQALLIASPSLESSIEHWIRNPDTKRGLRTERSLVRYFARMTGRATPFGLFAGCSVGTVAAGSDTVSETDLSLQSRRHCKTQTRLDYLYLAALTADLEAIPELRAGLRYWPAASLHRKGDFWHYIEPRIVGKHILYHSVRLESDQTLEALIKRAQEGATFQEQVEVVRSLGNGDISVEEATIYVTEAINAKVLTPRLSPLVTGRPALDDLIDQLRSLPSGAHIGNALVAVRAAMAAMDQRGLGTTRRDYEAIAENLERLATTIDFSCLFEVDLMKPLERGLLGQTVISELAKGIEFLGKVGAAPPREPERLRAFRQAYGDRYGAAWMPLLEVLDEDVGIGFGQSVHQSFGESSSEFLSVRQEWRPTEELDEFHATLLRKVIECAKSCSQELVLEASDFPTTLEHRFLPTAFSVIASIAASSLTAVHDGDFRVFLRSGVGPPGATLLGRFCQADPELGHLVRRHLCEEEANDPETWDQDAVYAEIVHLPEGRGGNIVARPCLREYEIECFGRSGCPVDKQLPLSDLLVTVNGKQVVLYSQRLRKRIIPRLTAAHGFNGPSCPTAYQLLGYLQCKPVTNVPRFEWGPLEKLPTLPRVRMGRVIFAAARWRISRKECKDIRERSRYERFFAVQELRRNRNLPRWVLFSQNENKLPVDLDNPLSVESFSHAFGRSDEATLLEMYPPPDELCVRGPEGHFQHELVIPFVTRDSRQAPERARPTGRDIRADQHILVHSLCRRFPPGSEWLCIRLYGGTAILEQTLLTVLTPLIRAAASDGTSSSWFFVHYSQPHPHLRIRINGAPHQLTRELLPRIHSATGALIEQRCIWKMEVDTYDRELERYGGLTGMLHSEQVFFSDSEAVVTILQALGQDSALDQRLTIAILGVDRLLLDCGLDLAVRHAAVRRARDVVHQDVRVHPQALKRLNERFRAARSSLETALEGSHQTRKASPFLETIWEAFKSRSQHIRAVGNELQNLRQSGQLSQEVCDIALSYAQAHVNRLIPWDIRAHELLVYDFLTRYYQGRLARE